jgi:hypothetical protein
MARWQQADVKLSGQRRARWVWAALLFAFAGLVGSALGESSLATDAKDDLDGTTIQPTLDETNWLGLDAAPLTGTIVTDRPDFTESTSAVPRGRFQLEAGYTFTYNREGGQRDRVHTAPELLLRVGAADGFELRFGWEGYAWTDTTARVKNDDGRSVTADDWSQGASDVELGFKLELAEQDGWQPELALLGALTAPSGSVSTSSGDVDPLLGVIWAYELTDRVGIGGQVLLGTPTEEDSRFVQTGASVTMGVGLTDRLGAYVEYFGIYPNTQHTDCAHVVNGGLTYLVTDDLQLDWRAGFGLNEEADDFFTGVGFSWRW